MKHIRFLLPGTLLPGTLLPVIILLPVVMLLSACQESLPAYEEPDTPLSAGIIVNAQLWRADVVRLSPDFSVKITNMSNEIDSWVLPAPYDVSVDISVFLARDPTRKVVIENSKTFDGPIDDLKWGYFVVLGFDLPLTDNDGRSWNWEYPDVESLDLILQGKVRIPQLDLEVNTPRARTSLYFITP